MIMEIKPGEYINTDHITYFKKELDSNRDWYVSIDLIGRSVTVSFDNGLTDANALIRKLLKACND